MKAEIWGTFSVRDHLRPRSFIAEALLYDRLVIPRPPTEEEEAPFPGEEDELARWRRCRWQPARLRRLLDILREGNLALELPWDKQARSDWAALYQEPHAEQIGAGRAELMRKVQDEIEFAKAKTPQEAPYIATEGVIYSYVTQALKHNVAERLFELVQTPDVPIEAVISYGSYRKFANEQHVQRMSPKRRAGEPMPYCMFGWEFFVPEDTDKSEDELLRGAVKLALRADLRETRQSFQGWLRQMHVGGADPEAARTAMLKMLQEYRAIIRGEPLKTVARYAAKVVAVTAPFASLVDPVTGAVAGAAGAAAPFVVDWLYPKTQPPERLRPAAFVHDVRQFFGKV